MSTTLTSSSPWLDQAASDTYEDTKKLIYKMAHKYAHQEGLPFEEVLSAAHFVFMRAFRYKYRPKGKPASFSTRLYNSLNWELRDFLKKEGKHCGALELNEELVGAAEYDANYRVMIESELSEDAKAIVALVLDTPDDIQMLLKWEGAKTQAGVVRALQGHLKDLGWTGARIAESFNEIRHLLAQ